MRRVLLALPDDVVRVLDMIARQERYGGNRSEVIRDAIRLRLAVEW